MTESYSPVSISKGPLSTSLLQRMVNNDQWLFEHTPKMKYVSGVSRSEGVKVLAGRLLYGANDAAPYQDLTVYFGSFFTVNVPPIVVATCEVITNGYRRLATVRNVSSNSATFHISNQEGQFSDQTKIVSSGYIAYIAIGV